MYVCMYVVNSPSTDDVCALCDCEDTDSPAAPAVDEQERGQCPICNCAVTAAHDRVEGFGGVYYHQDCYDKSVEVTASFQTEKRKQPEAAVAAATAGPNYNGPQQKKQRTMTDFWPAAPEAAAPAGAAGAAVDIQEPEVKTRRTLIMKYAIDYEECTPEYYEALLALICSDPCWKIGGCLSRKTVSCGCALFLCGRMRSRAPS